MFKGYEGALGNILGTPTFYLFICMTVVTFICVLMQS